MTQGNGPQYHNLDILRAVAVSAVIVDHLVWVNNGSLGRISADALGRAGVLLFFVHTSCVLMMSAERLQLHGKKLLGSFLLRRVFRIYPLSILTVLLVTALKVPAYPNVGDLAGWQWPGWFSIFSNLLLVQNITLCGQITDPLWSLPYEVQMYCVLPGIFELTRKSPRRSLTLFVVVSVVIAALFFIKNHHIGPSIRGLNLLVFAPCFLCGVYLWSRIGRSNKKFTGVLWPFVVIATVLSYCLLVPQQFHGGQLEEVVKQWLVCIAIALLYPLFADINISWCNKLAHGIAKYSYGVYLAHFPIFWVCFVQMKSYSWLYQYSLMLVLLIAVPFILFHVLEDPAIRLGRQLAEAAFADKTEKQGN